MEDGNPINRQIWLRAFYGFNPEEAGYIGFTKSADRETMFGKMQDGDLVLIYGAVDDLTQTDLKSQALGFLEIELEHCEDRERMAQSAIDWKIENDFAERWTFGIKVRRAWRINNRVNIKMIAPNAYHNKNRFERTTRAMLLDAAEHRRALSHPVRQVNVFGEAPLADDDLGRGRMSTLLKPSRGVPPKSGKRTSNYEDGENQLYLMMLSEKAGALLGGRSRYSGYALAKVGRSNDPKRRLKEVNCGFPESAAFRWELKCMQKFENAKRTHELEQELIAKFDGPFHSQGGEFFAGEQRKLVSEFELFCALKLPAILGASVRP